MRNRRTTRAVLLLAATSLVGGSAAGHDVPHGASALTDSGVSAPIRITIEALHAHAGVPPGWAFALPPGSAPEGREVLRTIECFACDAVRGEHFPRASRPREFAGPDLTGMGSHDPPEYFAESILNRKRVIVQASGYSGPDGLSPVPSYAESMTLQKLVDIVANFRSPTTSKDPPRTPSGSMHRH